MSGFVLPPTALGRQETHLLMLPLPLATVGGLSSGGFLKKQPCDVLYTRPITADLQLIFKFVKIQRIKSVSRPVPEICFICLMLRIKKIERFLDQNHN